jgi:hypothetical protein
MPARRGSGGEWLRFGVGEPFGVSDFRPSLRRDSTHFPRPAAYFRADSALLVLLVRWTFSFVGPQTAPPAKPMTSPLSVADVALKAVGFTYVAVRMRSDTTIYAFLHIPFAAGRTIRKQFRT